MKVTARADIYDISIIALNRLSARVLPCRAERLLKRFIGNFAYAVFGSRRKLIAERMIGYLGNDLAHRRIKELTKENFLNRVIEDFSYADASRSHIPGLLDDSRTPRARDHSCQKW